MGDHSTALPNTGTAAIRILLADGHDGIRRRLRRLLEASGRLAVCAEAKDGEEAVRLTVELRPQLTILDLSMPRLSGIDAARQIRAVLPETRIMIVTLHPLPDCAMSGPAVHAWIPKQEIVERLVPAVLAMFL